MQRRLSSTTARPSPHQGTESVGAGAQLVDTCSLGPAPRAALSASMMACPLEKSLSVRAAVANASVARTRSRRALRWLSRAVLRPTTSRRTCTPSITTDLYDLRADRSTAARSPRTPGSGRTDAPAVLSSSSRRHPRATSAAKHPSRARSLSLARSLGTASPCACARSPVTYFGSRRLEPLQASSGRDPLS